MSTTPIKILVIYASMPYYLSEESNKDTHTHSQITEDKRISVEF